MISYYMHLTSEQWPCLSRCPSLHSAGPRQAAKASTPSHLGDLLEQFGIHRLLCQKVSRQEEFRLEDLVTRPFKMQKGRLDLRGLQFLLAVPGARLDPKTRPLLSSRSTAKAADSASFFSKATSADDSSKLRNHGTASKTASSAAFFRACTTYCICALHKPTSLTFSWTSSLHQGSRRCTPSGWS